MSPTRKFPRGTAAAHSVPAERPYAPAARAAFAALPLAAALLSGCVEEATGPPGIGTLNLVSVPSGAAVTMDDSPVQWATPHLFDSLRVGPHRVTLSLPGYADTSITFTIARYDIRSLTVALPFDYRRPTSPAIATRNIAALFMRRNPELYPQLLAPGFKFRFQDSDKVPGQSDSLDYDDEVQFGWNLLLRGKPANGLPQAVRVTAELDVHREESDPRPGHAGWVRCATHTYLSISFRDSSRVEALTAAWLTYMPDWTGTWKLAEWSEFPDANSPGVRRATWAVTGGMASRWARAAGFGPQPASPPSWGRLRRLYR
ncbi:MAG: PEGA domain-containing protein [Candidatus Eisenbacteria bacterium]|nr:PEGA domain-containing protein [Candidatus Eisenbacteria bacterium]